MTSPSLNTTLTTIQFYTLLAVADRPLHGYAIRDQIAYDSDSTPALTSLINAGLLEAVDAPEPNITRRYRITATGRRRLHAEAIRLQRAASHARLKLGDSPLRP